MMRHLPWLMMSAALLLLSGCAASLPISSAGDCYNKSLPTLLDATDLKALFQDIASELCLNGRPRLSSWIEDAKPVAESGEDEEISRSTVLVTDFADIQSFQPHQSGLLMGELMRGALNDVCGHRIIQAEFAKYFKLSENGLVVLTRKVNEIKQGEYSQPEVVVGTYSYLNNNKILIFVRKISTETGTISRMVTSELRYTCGARSVTGYSVK